MKKVKRVQSVIKEPHKLPRSVGQKGTIGNQGGVGDKGQKGSQGGGGEKGQKGTIGSQGG